MFEWVILSMKFPADHGRHSDRTAENRVYLEKLKFEGIDFPVKVTAIDRFENHKADISVNVLGWVDGLYQIRLSSERRTNNVDLLLLVSGDNQHYILIKDLGRLCHKNSKLKGRRHPCRRCLQVFYKQDLLDAHMKDCIGIGKKPQRIEMPVEGKNIIQFKNHHKHMQAPYIIYSDFEALNITVEGPACNPIESNTRLIANQVPCSFSYIVVRSDRRVENY